MDVRGNLPDVPEHTNTHIWHDPSNPYILTNASEDQHQLFSPFGLEQRRERMCVYVCFWGLDWTSPSRFDSFEGQAWLNVTQRWYQGDGPRGAGRRRRGGDTLHDPWSGITHLWADHLWKVERSVVDKTLFIKCIYFTMIFMSRRVETWTLSNPVVTHSSAAWCVALFPIVLQTTEQLPQPDSTASPDPLTHTHAMCLSDRCAERHMLCACVRVCVRVC